VRAVFAAGRRCLLRCALSLRQTFAIANDHTGYYLLNKVWVDDLAVWLQRVDSKALESFTADLVTCVAKVCGSGKADLVGGLGARLEKADKWADSSEEEDEEEDEEGGGGRGEASGDDESSSSDESR